VADNWPADESGRADFAAVMERMVETYGSDRNAKDITRVLRVPGYLNRKNGTPHLVRIVDVNGRHYTRAEIREAFPLVQTATVLPFTRTTARTDSDRIRDALAYINADNRDTWLKVGMAIEAELGPAGRPLWDEWSAQSAKYNERDQEATWRSFKGNGVTVGTLFHEAKQNGWRDDNYGGFFVATSQAKATDAGGNNTPGVTLDDFHAYMPMHNYIFAPTREMWPASSVNARIPPVPLLDANGRQVLNKDGEPKHIPGSAWLDRNKPVEQMTWAPGQPMIIQDQLIATGGFIEHKGVNIFNQYRPPTLQHGDPGKAGPWLDHIRKIYPDDADHLIRWLAHRVQRPHEKINHAIVLGGKQGIGKDTLLEPVKRAIGSWNFEEVSPQQVLGRFTGFLKSVILRVSEARDLGEFDRFKFYDHAKAYTAAPPDVLRIDEKHLREYSIPNVCGIIITTNHKTDGIYLPADDRRHYVAWSELSKDDFDSEYWTNLWCWYEAEGYGHVAAYLAALDLSNFDAKAPPPKTPAFWEIVDASRAPEDAEMQDAIDHLGDPNPDALTINQLKRCVPSESFGEYLKDRKNSRRIPYRLESCGYVAVRNDAAKDGLWKMIGGRQVIYAKSDLSLRDRIIAAKKLAEQQGGHYG
jgi:hypothetical protein